MKSILIVEDDEAIRDSATELLEQEGYFVLSATNGQSALNYLQTANRFPDLILLDIMLPFMDGMEFAAEKLSDSRIKNIPIVLMSADGQLGVKKVTTQAQAFLKKPFEWDELVSLVRNTIDSNVPSKEI